MHYQLYLSMVWDRVDIAEEKIFVHGSECLGKQSSIRWVVKNLTVGYKISMILLPNKMCFWHLDNFRVITVNVNSG